MNGIRRAACIVAEFAAFSVPCLLSIATAGKSYGATATPAVPSITVVATIPVANTTGSSVGLLTFTSSSAVTGDLTVKFALGGTAAKWTDYYRLPEGDMPVSVTIPAGAVSVT